MEIICDQKNCVGCRACKSICPVQCITMETNSEGFWFPKIDTLRCIDCGACKKVCPGSVDVNREKMRSFIDESISAQNISMDTRRQSSSGGIITLLAERVIQEGGVVFGAAFSSDCRCVQHIEITCTDELWRIMGSKYVQSDIGGSYLAAKKRLKEGRRVLFIGTPCQVAGLHLFLQSPNSRLTSVDFVCHGVPSPLVWNEHICELESQYGKRVESVNFRLKQPEWKNYSIRYTFADGHQLTESSEKSRYLHGFLSNLYLRQSCEICRFKGNNRYSDITVADHWGVWDVAPEMDDRMGTSLVIAHSNNGRELINQVQDRLKFVSTSLDESIRYNLSYVQSAAPSKHRKWFFKKLKRNGFSKTMKMYSFFMFLERIKYKLKRKKEM